MNDLVRVSPIDGGAFWRVTFGASKGNILDRPMLTALSRVFLGAACTPELKAICLVGAGDHFSFGASVREHLPDQVHAMFDDLRHLVLHLLDTHIVMVAAVRGQCLGGGLELASVCHRLIASRNAAFGQPEIALGVFAPIASLVLPERIGRARAEDLCLTGRILPADEAAGMGLVDELTDGDPAEAALAWMRAHFASRSAASLRYAVRAIRADLTLRIRAELPRLESVYLTELMATQDAAEGLQAFLDKRPPVWRHA
jgi:cyclohexa-1,5-dienecarbonyl-CoA hydratase